MTATLSRSTDAATITPDLVMPHDQHEDAPQTQVHPILGSEYPDITLRPARAATGRMRLFFTAYADADEARVFHRAAATFAITSGTMPWLPAEYVPTRISRVQQLDNLARWIVEVEYQEIAT